MTVKTAYFVTGTDTEIGKTLVSSALLFALVQSGMRAAGMKPVAAGAELRNGVWHNSDADCLAANANVALPQALATPYLLQEPASPHIAAACAGVTIDIAHIGACYDRVAEIADAVVVEGVGGLRVPLCDPAELSPGADIGDLAQRLALPVVLVVGMRLGCLNHALLTAEALAARGLRLAGWVANTVDPDMRHRAANIESLAMRLGAPLLGCIPRLENPSGAAAASYLDFSQLPAWPACT